MNSIFKGKVPRLFLLLLASSTANASLLPKMWPRATQKAPNCSSYSLQSGDTCVSIGSQHNITYAQVVAWNPDIKPACTNLPDLMGRSICVSNPFGKYSFSANMVGQTTTATVAAPIPTPTAAGTASNCGQFYHLQSGNDCPAIVDKFGISLHDFLFLNPKVFTNCTNLVADFNYCVKAVGDISAYPGYVSSSSIDTPPFKETPMRPGPNVGNLLASYTSSHAHIPIAEGTRVDCWTYEYFLNVTNNDAASCWSLAAIHGITPQELIMWNPSLQETDLQGQSDSSTSDDSAALSSKAMSMAAMAESTPSAAVARVKNPYAYPCSVAASKSYCVALTSPTATPRSASKGPPSPRAPGEVSGCTDWHKIASWDTCTNVAKHYELTMGSFLAMNPSVGPDCSRVKVGVNYCVSTQPDGDNSGMPMGSPPATNIAMVNMTVPSKTQMVVPAAYTPTHSPIGKITPTPIRSALT